MMGWLRWAIGAAGYLLRPYDMVADRRRWFWESRTPCGWIIRNGHPNTPTNRRHTQ